MRVLNEHGLLGFMICSNKEGSFWITSTNTTSCGEEIEKEHNLLETRNCSSFDACSSFFFYLINWPPFSCLKKIFIGLLKMMYFNNWNVLHRLALFCTSVLLISRKTLIFLLLHYTVHTHTRTNMKVHMVTDVWSTFS